MRPIQLSELTARKWGKLTVVDETSPSIQASGRVRRRLSVKCDCGNSIVVLLENLRTGHTTSCGCAGSRTKIGAISETHGDANKGKITPEYRTWLMMIQRCTNPKRSNYKYYGGRGITICDRWRNSYADFLADMGRRPTLNHSIDRIDVDGNYEPGNCRWATIVEQRRNRRYCRES